MKKDIRQKIDRISHASTPYRFNLADVPKEHYAEVLNDVFSLPDFRDAVEKRNRLVASAAQMRQNSPEMTNLIRTIQAHDRKLADTIFLAIVRANLESAVTYDFLSFSTLMRYFVNYSVRGMKERVDSLCGDLNKVTFLADMLESVVVDVKDEMEKVFGKDVEFRQFDAVLHVMEQLKGFFGMVRTAKADSEDAKLYMDYSDSINEYLSKRLKTYNDKYVKLHPVPPTYTESDMVKAINQFFGTTNKYGKRHLAHTSSGGYYVDAMRLASDMSPSETDKLDRLVSSKHKSPDAFRDYSFAVTDVILNTYKPE